MGMVHAAVQQRPIQYCKAIILQLKKKPYKEARRKNTAHREETEQAAESDAEMTQTLELSDKHLNSGYG